MHKANTRTDEDQPYALENSSTNHLEQPPTEAEEKALHFFDAGIGLDFELSIISPFSSYARRVHWNGLLFENGFCLDLWFRTNG